jgi:hypothetical protein
VLSWPYAIKRLIKRLFARKVPGIKEGGCIPKIKKRAEERGANLVRKHSQRRTRGAFQEGQRTLLREPQSNE